MLTIASVKLARLISATSATAVARESKSQPATLKLLAAGIGEPKLVTVRKLMPLGIQFGDWFTSADSSDDDLSGRPVTDAPPEAATSPATGSSAVEDTNL